MPSSYAVVGASRGIGLEFVRQLADRPDATVFAIARNPSSAHYLSSFASEHPNVHVIAGDVVDHKSLARAASEVAALSDGVLDVLIHNAARMNVSKISRRIDDYKDFDELDADFTDAFAVNALGVVHSVSAFLPLLRRGRAKKIVVISTIGANPTFAARAGPDIAAFTTTMAAGVLVSAKYAAGLRDEGFTVISMHPGVVDTSATAIERADQSVQDLVDKMEKTGRRAEILTPTQSVEAQLEVIDGLTPAQNGAFLTYAGQTVV